MAGLVLAGLSGFAMLIFGIQILVRAFRTSTGWGLASLFIPLAVLVFVFKHWPQTRKPFLGALACAPLYAGGFALMALGGGMKVTTTTPLNTEVADPTADLRVSEPRVETGALVFRTVRAPENVADLAALTPCTEAFIGATALTPKELRVCAHHTDFFGETKLEWFPAPREETFFGDPLAGQWVSWLHVTSKDTQKQAAFVVFNVTASQKGKMHLACDAGGMNRTQINGDPPLTPGFHDACEEVADKLGLGRIQFNWNAKNPRVRFLTRDGPAIDLALVKVV